MQKMYISVAFRLVHRLHLNLVISESVQPMCVVRLFDQGGDSMRMHEMNRMDDREASYVQRHQEVHRLHDNDKFTGSVSSISNQ